MSYFESRNGEMGCTPEEIFYFMTDMRNFKRFAPAGTVTNWHDEIDSCSFSVPHVGNVSVNLDRQEKYSLVSYKGDALKKNDFELILHIERREGNLARVKIKLNADLNPVMRMVAAKPIEQFLEMAIDRMERMNCSEELMR